MEIIKPGRPQKGWAIEHTCTGNGHGNGGCSALLLVSHDDLFLRYENDSDGYEVKYVTFKCPSCSQLTNISEIKYPPNYKTLPTQEEFEIKERYND